MEDWQDSLRRMIAEMNAPKPKPVRVTVPDPAALARRAASILEGYFQQPAIEGYEPPDIWSSRKVWTRSQAAWLALNIDPHLTDSIWRLDESRETDLRALVAEMESRLFSENAKEQAHPSEWLRIMRNLGLNHPWMPSDDPSMDEPSGREVPKIMEILTAALISRYGLEAVADLEAGRSEESGRIIRDLQVNGCHLTQTTIRKYLKKEVIQRHSMKLATTSSRTLPNR